jgi:hypothetical protein
MDEVKKLLDVIFVGQERLSSGELRRRAVATDASAEVKDRLEALPEGEYTYDEALAAVVPAGGDHTGAGVPAAELSDDDLSRELGHLHETRDDTFRHGSPQALEHHGTRTEELEAEFVRRFPDRAVDPRRLRPGGQP